MSTQVNNGQIGPFLSRQQSASLRAYLIIIYVWECGTQPQSQAMTLFSMADLLGVDDLDFCTEAGCCESIVG
jgi:hypothetical protein